MSQVGINAVEYTCDGCGKIELVMLGNEEPIGFHMTAYKIGGSFGTDTAQEIWACKESCIRQAVVMAIARTTGQIEE